MKKMVILWVITVIFLTCTLLFIGYSFMKENEKYHTLESDIKEAASLYVKNGLNLSIKEEKKISTNELIKNKYLSSMEVEDDECSGYVIIKRDINEYIYDVNIKCNNYKTGE